MFRIENITKRFSEEDVPIQNLSARVNKGDIIALIGPSGTGKSTLLRCLNMLDPPTEGKIFFHDQEITAKGYDLTKLRMKVGMVFQSYNLFNHLTAIENIMMPQVRLLQKTEQEAYDRGMELLERVGLKDKYLQYPSQLSGGQKQRVAIARAMAMEPEVLLLDEPTSSLDPAMVDEVHRVVRMLADTGMTIMIVTHDMNFARGLGNRVFFMDRGVICEEGTPDEIFDNPKKPETIQFIKKLRIIEGDIHSKNYDLMTFTEQILEMMRQTGQLRVNWDSAVVIMDELLGNILFTLLPESFRIHYCLECGKEGLGIVLGYTGSRLDMKAFLEEKSGKAASLEDMEDLTRISARMIMGYAKDISYTYEEDRELPNQLRIEIRNIA